MGRREIEALLTTQHTSTDGPSAVLLLGGHLGGAGDGRGGAARAPADAVRAHLQLAGGRRERWLRHPSRIAARVKFSSSATAACLSFAGQFLSQIGLAPVSATLQVVYLALFRPLWASPLGLTRSPGPPPGYGRQHLRSADARHHHVVAHSRAVPDGLPSPEEPFASPGSPYRVPAHESTRTATALCSQ